MGEERDEQEITCVCGAPMVKVWFREKERIMKNGRMQATGRTRMACSHLVCEYCGTEAPVDDTFDGPWE